MAKKKKTNKPSAVIKSPPSKKKKRVLFLRSLGGVVFSKIFLATLFLLVLLGGASYYLFISEAFAIRDVSVEGFSPSVEDRVAAYFSEIRQSKKLLFLDHDNTLIFPEEEFAQKAMASIPKIKDINVNINLPNSVAISGEEREQEGIWCDIKDEISQKCFFYDKEGIIYEEAPGSARGYLITTIRDARFDNYELPHDVLDKEILAHIGDLMQILENVNKKPSYITVQSHDEVRVGFTESSASTRAERGGWEAYFAFPGDASEQVENLLLVLNEEIGARTGDLEYVDLRLGNKAFYKFKE